MFNFYSKKNIEVFFRIILYNRFKMLTKHVKENVKK